MEIEDKVRHRRIQSYGIGNVIEISEFGTVRIDFGRAGKLWVSMTDVESATFKQDALNLLPARLSSVTSKPRLPTSSIKEGWLVEHDEFGWGEILAREGPNVLINFGIGEKALNYYALCGHVLQYDDDPAANDPRRAPLRAWPTGGSRAPGPKWARYRFGTPNTISWRKF